MGVWKDMFNDAVEALAFRDMLYAVSTGDNKFIANYLQQWPEGINKKDIMYGRNALMHATLKGRTDTVKLLLDKGASIRGSDLGGYNVLHMAAIRGSSEKTALLLDRADIASILNEKNPAGGLSALMYAAAYPQNTEVVKLLLEKGADATLTDFTGMTALAIARKNGCAKTVALLEEWSKGQNLTESSNLTESPKPTESLKPAERSKPKRYKF